MTLAASAPIGPLLAAQEETFHRFARLQSLTEGWQWLALAAVCLGLMVYVVSLYRRDSVELPRGLGLVLMVLRTVAFALLLFYFLDLEKGTERTLVANSRAVVLMDLSQSMAQRDLGDTVGQGGPSRAEAVRGALDKHRFLERLRERHDVAVLGFSDGERPAEIASFAKRNARLGPGAEREALLAVSLDHWRQARVTGRIALGILAVAAGCLLVYLVGLAWGRRVIPGETGGWTLLAATVLGITGLVVLAVAHLRYPEAGLAGLAGLAPAPAPAAPAPSTPPPAPAAESAARSPADVDWATELAPRGQQTRLGDALRQTVNRERGGPISGIVLISDGQGNAGIDASQGAVNAQEAGIPVYTVAVGGSKPPVNARLVDVEAPQRVYPGDRFSLKAYVQSFGLKDRSVRVELHSAPAEAKEGEQETFVEEKTLTLGEEGATQPIEFEPTPAEVGKRRYTLRLAGLDTDRDPTDNVKSANVEVVDDKNRVLLIAGGPTREYRFLRNMLFRDRDATSVVLLQSGEPGISQESDEILFEFPRTEDEMFEYDCIVAFDPDWLQLDAAQLRLLERWVSEQAGGLVVVAGPVYTPEWTRLRRGADPRVDVLKALYPVVFASEASSSLNLGRVGGDQAWPLHFTRDGLAEKFLWLEDDPVRNEEAWATFEGVFGYFAIRDVKKGTRIFARFSDPQEQSLDSEQPVYMAAHFYGAGRVFFAASGEMWRLRAVKEEYFQTFYTKLLRWVSQGRLLRDSSHGVLLVDKERCFIGDRVTVSARLTDAQRQPLKLPKVEAALRQPDGKQVSLELRMVEDASREGEYQGQFTPVLEGDYRVELAPPESITDLLVQEVRCGSSAAEMRQPLRNDALLKEIADRTRGQFYDDLDVALGAGRGGQSPIVELLTPQDQETRLPGTPDRRFKQLLSTWLLGLISGVLGLEWLLRRLSRLA